MRNRPSRQLKHKIAGALFPRYSLTIDQMNYNAMLDRWLNQNDMPVFPDRTALHRFVCELSPCSPVDYLEFGVFKGDSIKMWSRLNQHPDSRFVGFDSFEGLPEAWGRAMSAGDFGVQGNLPVINDLRVTFERGWFNDTLPAFLQTFRPRSRLVVHNDSDLYSSSLYLLAQLDQFMVAGTVLIFDELYTALHEFRAYLDYASAFRRKLRPIGRSADTHGRVAFVFER